MAFTLPPLPFASKALEPDIDQQTMEIHHGKHHAAYVNNLNKALESAPQLAGKTIQAFRIHRDIGDGTNVEIQLTDGTSFSCVLSIKPAVSASLYRGGVGTPEILLSHEF